MWTDPIVNEVRGEREKHAARFNYDLEAIFRDLKEHEEKAREEGWTVVSLPPRRSDSSETTAV